MRYERYSSSGGDDGKSSTLYSTKHNNGWELKYVWRHLVSERIIDHLEILHSTLMGLENEEREKGQKKKKQDCINCVYICYICAQFNGDNIEEKSA